MATPALAVEQEQNANLIYTLATHAGLTSNQALQMIGAAQKESGLREGAVNQSSGATGLFQLLSRGYVDAFQENMRQGQSAAVANVNAILPAYVKAWHDTPTAEIGVVPARVEASGESAAWYAGGINEYLAGSIAYLHSQGVKSRTELEQLYAPVSGGGSAPMTGASQALGGVNASGGMTDQQRQTVLQAFLSGSISQARAESLLGGPLKMDPLGGLPGGSVIAGPISSVADALKFVFSYRGLELLAGLVLILLGVVGLMREINVGPKIVLPGGADRALDQAFGQGITQGQQAQARAAGRRSTATVSGSETAQSERAGRIRREADADESEIPF